MHSDAFEVLGHACKAGSIVLVAAIALVAKAADITPPEMKKLQSLVKQTGIAPWEMMEAVELTSNAY